MWGDPERALKLDASDSLSMLLFQVASPAHIPWNDPRWQELLHGMNVWVHVEVRDDPAGVLHQASQSMAKHSMNSSNLAALARLVCQMLDELVPSNNNGSSKQADQVAAFSEKIAIVGKARAAAGALQLLRIFMHRILVDYGNQPQVLSDVFTYRNRDYSEKDVNVAQELLDSLFGFLTAERTSSIIVEVPEMYDTAVLTLQLLLVMLSTQLYQPMVSSFQQSQQTDMKQSNFFLDLILDNVRKRQAKDLDRLSRQEQPGNGNDSNSGRKTNILWTPKSLLLACLNWQIQRPQSPDRSIARYHYDLAKSVVAAKGEKVGPDGMYESNLVVSAAAQKPKQANEGKLGESASSLLSHSSHHQHHFLLDATRGVLVQASSIILLPFRLVSLALGLWGHKEKGFEQSRKSHFSSSMRGTSRTRDVLWVTESPVADLCSSLFLLLTNNGRAFVTEGSSSAKSEVAGEGNPFRKELSSLSDNRWESGHDSAALPDLPDPLGQPALFEESLSLLDSFERDNQQEALPGSLVVNSCRHMTMNFETLFLSFGAILHTEVGALLLYTLLQSSKAFSETIAVRSDLDTLVLPLLRTLYFSSSSRHVSAMDFQSKGNASKRSDSPRQGSEKSLLDTNKSAVATPLLSIRTCPFRSQSQLYLIVILLLLLSQDTSFGSDAFRRTIVSSVPWYKERYLKDISLGSIMLLTLVRSLTFNLNRLRDMFLLSNCCAVLMNLSHSVVDIHEYAAMRLASVTVSCLKKYVAMAKQDGKNGKSQEEDGAISITDMYAEVSHTLLRLIKHALNQKAIDRNLHLVYALVYHQAEFKKIFSMKGKSVPCTKFDSLAFSSKQIFFILFVGRFSL